MLLGLGALGSCRPLPPRGTAPAELARGLPRLVLLRDAGPVSTALWVRAGVDRDPVDMPGLSFRVAHARATSGAHVGVGPHGAVIWQRCEVAATCVLAASQWMTAPDPSAYAGPAVDAARTKAWEHDRGGAAARHLLDAVRWAGHPRAWPPAGRAVAPSDGAASAAVAHDARQLVRQGAVVGLAGAVDRATIDGVMAAARALAPSPPPLDDAMGPAPLRQRVVHLAASDTPGFAVGALSVPDTDDVALRVGLAALDGGVADPCAGAGPPWLPAPGAATRSVDPVVGGDDPSPVDAVGRVLDAVSAGRIDGSLGAQRLREAAARRLDPVDGCALAAQVEAVALGVDEAAAASLDALDTSSPDPAAVVGAVRSAWSGPGLVVAIVGPDPEALREAVRAAGWAAGMDVVVHPRAPWR